MHRARPTNVLPARLLELGELLLRSLPEGRVFEDGASNFSREEGLKIDVVIDDINLERAFEAGKPRGGPGEARGDERGRMVRDRRNGRRRRWW